MEKMYENGNDFRFCYYFLEGGMFFFFEMQIPSCCLFFFGGEMYAMKFLGVLELFF